MPWVIPAITAATSIYSSVRAGSQRKKAERAIENMQTPVYKPNQSILDYYDMALQRYNTAPTETAEYKLQRQNIGQGTTQALSALQDRRFGQSGVSNVIQNQNNSLLKAAIAGEQRKIRDFSILTDATRLKAGEDTKAFQQNYIAPFEKNYNLMAMKAAGQAQVQNSAMRNAYNNILAGANLYMGDNDSGGKFGRVFGDQGGAAYNWAKSNGLNFRKYMNLYNTVSPLRKLRYP